MEKLSFSKESGEEKRSLNEVEEGFNQENFLDYVLKEKRGLDLLRGKEISVLRNKVKNVLCALTFAMVSKLRSKETLVGEVNLNRDSGIGISKTEVDTKMGTVTVDSGLLNSDQMVDNDFSRSIDSKREEASLLQEKSAIDSFIREVDDIRASTEKDLEDRIMEALFRLDLSLQTSKANSLSNKGNILINKNALDVLNKYRGALQERFYYDSKKVDIINRLISNRISID